MENDQITTWHSHILDWVVKSIAIYGDHRKILKPISMSE